MGKTHVVQHRPSREGAHARELADNRRQINKLTREVARLRRQLQKSGISEVAEDGESMASNDSRSQTSNSNSSGSSVIASGGKQGFLTISTPATCLKCGAKELYPAFTTPTGNVVSVCKACKDRTIKGRDR